MEMSVVENPHEALPVQQSPQRLPEEQRRVLMVQQERHHHGLLQGGVTRQVLASGLPILEMYAACGGGDTGTVLAPRVQCDAAASSKSVGREGVLPYPSMGYGIDQREKVGPLGRFRSLSIEDKGDLAGAAALRNHLVDPCGIWSRQMNESSESIIPNSSPFSLRNSTVPPDHEKPLSPGRQQHRRLTSSCLGPCIFPDGLYSESLNFLNNDRHWTDLQLHMDFGLGGNVHHSTAQAVSPLFSSDRLNLVEDLLVSQKKKTGCSGYSDALVPPILSQKMLPSSHTTFSVLSQEKGVSSSCYSVQSVSPFRSSGVKAFPCGESLIIQGNELHCLGGNSNSGHHQRDRRKSHTDGLVNSLGYNNTNLDHLQIGAHRFPTLPPKYNCLMDLWGVMRLAAKDQYGCRFLQHKFDEGNAQEKEMIFNEIISYVAELMVNPFGNYLMQKVLDVCTEDQRLEIILALTKDPTELARISLNMHGTRAVQRLIETLKDKKQITLVISALQPGFLSLIKDPNGNHVIQRCLQYFGCEDSKFIFEAASRHCVDIARHRHGCCVLQRCIAHATGQHQVKLVSEVSRNGLLLAQDAYGNYAVQYILDMQNQTAIEALKSEFRGNYVQLSTQKFSSNVVEKCISVFDEVEKRRIISELLSAPSFEQLLQDPYANYVIQRALLVCKGHARTLLADAIRPHDAILRTSPYCKRIFNLLKK